MWVLNDEFSFMFRLLFLNTMAYSILKQLKHVAEAFLGNTHENFPSFFFQKHLT